MLGDMEIMLLLTGLGLGLVLGVVGGVLWMRARPDETPRVAAALDQRAADQAVVKEGLERLHDQLRDFEHNRVSWQGQLAQQVLDIRHTTDLLRRETSSLATALRRPQVRGRWGELHLKRAVELAGMVDHVDFTEQERLDDGARRPDLIVRLAGGRQAPHPEALAANRHSLEELRTWTGVDSLKHLSLASLAQCLTKPEEYCYACFDGNYPLEME